MYTCGTTVHAEPTLGLLRRAVITDVLRRHLESLGFEVRHVMNITDVDDNTIAASERRGVSLRELTHRYTEEFMRALDALSVRRAWKYPRASEHVEDMVAFTRRLIEKGHAYERLRSVYFDIGKWPRYGSLRGPLESGAVREAVGNMTSEFEAAMNADLNVPAALGAVFSLVRRLNPLLVGDRLSAHDARLVIEGLRRVDAVLAVFDFETRDLAPRDPEVEGLVAAREEARARKDFAEADRLRDELARRGVVVEDTVHGTLWWRE